MILTEDEARTKWCPAFRISYGGEGSDPHDNRGDTPGNNGRCIASRCMAWRWSGEAIGYCGLSGKPEGR